MKVHAINRKLYFGVMCLLLLCILSGCRQQKYSLIGTVKGRVISSSNKSPVSGAKIYVDKYAFNAFDTVLTNGNGQFEINGIKVNDFEKMKLQRDISYLFFVEKEGFNKRTIDIKDFKSIKDTVDLGTIAMDTLLTKHNNLVGNVYVLDSTMKDVDQIQDIRIDEIQGRTLRMKYKIGAEQFLDADFTWHESIGMWLSSKPLTYGNHAQNKSGARLFIKENALQLQLEGEKERLSFRKLYNKPVDLETHRDPYHAEDGFSIEKSPQKLTQDIYDAIKQAEQAFSRYLPKILKSRDAMLDVLQSYTGDFTGDGIEDVAIYFSLGPANGGNAVVGRGLALYKNEGHRVKVIAGYEPDYLFTVDTISNGKIMVEKMEYAPEDGRCCPSIRSKYILTIEGNRAY